MDAIDILGSLLGGSRAGRGGGGADILASVLGGRPKSAPTSNQPSSPPAKESSRSKSIDDLLRVNLQPNASRQAPAQQQSRQPAHPSPSVAHPGQPTDIFGQRPRQEPKINLAAPKPTATSQNDQAILLIRGMINSAKVDGEISEEEQQKILGQVGDTSPETIQFLRSEFARPLDVNEYALSIPIGMEHKAYGFALMAIKLDSKPEADYLRQLAQSLRISPEECNQMHQQQDAPLIYQA